MISITSKRTTTTGELVEVAAVRNEPNMSSYVSVFARVNGGAWKTISPIMKNDKGIYGSFMNKYAVLRSEYDAAQKEWSNMPKSVEELLEIYKSLRESVAFSGGNLSSAIHAGDCAEYAKAAMKDKNETKTALQELQSFMIQNPSIVAEYEKRQKDNAQRFIEAGF
jgi:hypothetical protein